MVCRDAVFLLHGCLLIGSALLTATPAVAQSPPGAVATKPGYVQLIAVGYEFFTQGKTKEAYTSALMAAQVNPGGFESYALAAAIMHVRGEYAYAKDFVEKALARADAAQKGKLRDLATVIDKALAARGGQVAPAVAGTWSGALKGAYTYDQSPSKPLDATFVATLQPGGTGSATLNARQQSITWTQTGRDVVIESLLKNVGCVAMLTIRATINGPALNGTFSISGPSCASASGTWTAKREP